MNVKLAKRRREQECRMADAAGTGPPTAPSGEPPSDASPSITGKRLHPTILVLNLRLLNMGIIPATFGLNVTPQHRRVRKVPPH